MQRKTDDYDRWLQGMRRLRARFLVGECHSRNELSKSRFVSYAILLTRSNYLPIGLYFTRIDFHDSFL